jgi:hypothetical protein
MATFNHELHKQLMERKQYALAALVVDGHITDGKSLMAKQQANLNYFELKKQAVKKINDRLFQRGLRHLYKQWLISKHKPQDEHEDLAIVSWENWQTM